MWFRLKRSRFNSQKGEGNRQAMKAIVDSGEIPGLIGYARGESNKKLDKPIGWISIAPRERFPVLERSRILKRIDQQPVWSIVCFFVNKDYRNRGVTGKLLESALEYARENGAKIVEAYPVEPKKSKSPDVFLYHGLFSSFEKAGFIEVARRSETRPLMRYYF
jgi:GNAT superfamily N-acetyltransferase